MKIVLDSQNILPKSRKKSLKNLELHDDVFVPGGLPAMWSAQKVGLLVEGRVKVFKDRYNNRTPYITTIKEFLS